MAQIGVSPRFCCPKRARVTEPERVKSSIVFIHCVALSPKPKDMESMV